jgi:hypothetical protein
MPDLAFRIFIKQHIRLRIKISNVAKRFGIESLRRGQHFTLTEAVAGVREIFADA